MVFAEGSAPGMRKWLSGRASPCQGEGREFESRLPLHRGLVYQIEGAFLMPGERCWGHVGGFVVLRDRRQRTDDETSAPRGSRRRQAELLDSGRAPCPAIGGVSWSQGRVLHFA